MRTSPFLMVVLAACGDVDSGSLPDAPAAPDAAISADAAMADSPVTPVACDSTKRWDTPVPVPGLAISGAYQESVRLSPDELSAYFQRLDLGRWNLYAAHRSSRSEPFGAPIALSTVNSPAGDMDPWISSDGLTLWFASDRVQNQGSHLYVATRTTTLAEFGAPGLAANVNASNAELSELQPFVTAGGEELWFASNRSAGADWEIYRALRTPTGFGMPAIVAELASSTSTDWLPMLSADRLTVYFSSSRPGTGTKGNLDVWTARRSTVNDGFPPPVLADELNTPGGDRVTWLSGDGCRIYGSSDGAIWMATRLP